MIRIANPQRALLICLVALMTVSSLSTSANSAANLNDPYEILHRHYAAVGGIEVLKALKTGYHEARISYDGLTGTLRQWEQTPLLYRRDEDFGVIRQTAGDNGNFDWRVDTNGKIQIIKDPESLKRRRIRALLEDFQHIERDSTVFRLFFEGVHTIDGTPCYKIRMTNTINQDINWDFFDVGTFLRRYSIYKQPDIEVHTRYKDHRWVGPVLNPFYERSEIHPRDKVVELQITDYQLDIPISPNRFQPPAKDVVDFSFGNQESAREIDFEFTENNIYLTLTIAGQPNIWLLDNGASNSVVDADFVQRLGLTPAGTIKGSGFGDNFDLAFVELPPIKLKNLTLQPQKIFAFKGLSDRFFKPGLVGLLGYDFLSRFVTRVDYANRKISFFDPAAFRYKGKGHVMPAPLHHKVFTIQMTVENRFTGTWDLDLGAYDISFHYPYAEQQGLLGRPGVQRLAAGMAGTYQERLTPFTSTTIGPYTIDQPVFSIPQSKGQGTTANAERIGTIGNALLRHFVVYLDYQRQQVIFEPGHDFNRRFAMDHSGLQLWPNEHGQAEVAYVAADTPAQAAGFQEGEVLLTIDDQPIQGLAGILKARAALRGNPGKIIAIGCRYGDSQYVRKMVLKDLFRPSSTMQTKKIKE